MSAPLTAPLPESLILDAGFTVTLAAINPTTGAPVAGVVVSDGTMTKNELGPLPMLDVEGPLLAHQPQDGANA